nr:hypothetical protein Q903MT_gene1004 [Picea sitchensis]
MLYCSENPYNIPWVTRPDKLGLPGSAVYSAYFLRLLILASIRPRPPLPHPYDE